MCIYIRRKRRRISTIRRITITRIRITIIGIMKNKHS